MPDQIGETKSLCPECFNILPARKVVDAGSVYLEKNCPDHGSFKVLIWRGGSKQYQDWGDFGLDMGAPAHSLTQTRRGCPYDCGLCPSHKAATCIGVMELTLSCNLHCPVCFARAGGNRSEPSLNKIKSMFQTLMQVAGGPCPVQLSGGEPTVREDMDEIINLGRKAGFSHIEINTNGIRIAEDIEYLRKLKESGASTVFLSFDGVSDDVYRRLRGDALFSVKIRAIENCAEVKIGVILVPTLIPRVNDHQIGDIIQFAKEWIPIVKGVHFQPRAYLGRYPNPPQDEDRLTIPDLLKSIEDQTKGEIKGDNFTPRRRKESFCGFSGFFLLEDGRLIPTVNLNNVQDFLNISDLRTVKAPFEQARKYVSQHWQYTEPKKENPPAKKGSWRELLEQAGTQSLSISCMPFQDIWSIDLDRLQRCCTHVVRTDGRIMPLCSNYLTNCAGERLHK